MKTISAATCDPFDASVWAIAAVAPTVRIRFLGLTPESTAPSPTALGGVIESSACIHFGISGSASPAAGLFHCRAARPSRRQRRGSTLSQLDPVEGAPLSVVAEPPTTTSTSPPTTAIPSDPTDQERGTV